tara:strand:+ start:303 stop:503 length:201 start_codon:yes stop_codon:yes gene_type:complete
MPHDTLLDKESYQARLSSSDRFRLRSTDNVVKGIFDFFALTQSNVKKQPAKNRKKKICSQLQTSAP